MPVTTQRRIIETIAAKWIGRRRRSAGRMPVVLCSPQIRATVRRLIETALPHMAVLGYNEVGLEASKCNSLGVAVLSHESANVPSTVHA